MSGNSPLVAINIPVYNGDKYILEALSSIQNQNYENFECNIINNCSTDNTKSIVEEFIKNDNRFFLQDYKEFADINVNWNRCINHLKPEAKYLKVVQADDIIFENSISIMVDLMEKHLSAGVGSSYRLTENAAYGFGLDYLDGNLFDGKEVLLAHLRGKMEITGSITQLFFRINTLKKLPKYPTVFDKEEYHFDSRLAYELFNISDLVFAHEILNYSRRPDTSETMTKVYALNTLLHGKESRLNHFKDLAPDIKKIHNQVRQQYAYFLLKNKLRGNKKCIEWHNKYLLRKPTPLEYLKGIVFENRFGNKLKKLVN